MKLWKFGSVLNAFVLTAIFGFIVAYNLKGATGFVELFSGRTKDVVSDILYYISFNLKDQWYLTWALVSTYSLTLFLFVILPTMLVTSEIVRSRRPRMGLYFLISLLTLPIGGGLFMLLSIAGLKNSILRNRIIRTKEIERELELEDEHYGNVEYVNSFDTSKTLYSTIKEQDDVVEETEDFKESHSTMTNEYTSDPSNPEDFESHVEQDQKRQLKEKLIELEDELDKVKDKLREAGKNL